ncbi:cyanophycinase [Rubricoccus marinus]|uniref:Cyanophycinase n=1 Tax=Rubricoccus marinus TaxID=716817 RepID=A0A259TWW6_9BACT|nr:cyanophycinase [Rubricoccus marinus]OZC02038.1 cyanophycinase [Rubricoccus marinus]
MPSTGTPGVSRGYIVPVGGAEKKTAEMPILKRFVKIAGGGDARIVVIPTASELEDTGDRYVDLFEGLYVEAARSLPITTREHAMEDECVAAIEDATAVFLTGGNQLRLSTILGGSPVAKAIRRRNADGMHVGGTSAGAAILPEHMIAGGRSGHTPRVDGVVMAPGLGLTNRLLIDQHFRQRDRLGRLLTAVSFNPFAVGVGLDEDTAIFLGPDGSFEVVGSGAVTVVDPTGLTYSSMDSAAPKEPVSLIGLQLHLLAEGARYDVETRQAFAPDPSAQ